MKFALILFGISYQSEYEHFSKKIGTINYKKSFENYQNTIFPLMGNFDTFLCTNHSPIEKQLIADYQPKAFNFLGKNRNERVIWALYECIKYANETQTKYEMVLLTRFDLIFLKELVYDSQSINLISVLEAPNLIDDNFYLFPFDKINEFYAFCLSQHHSVYPHYHHCLPQLEKISKVNFIHNESTGVINLTSYQIYREWLYVFHNNICRPLSCRMMPFTTNNELILEGFYDDNKIHQYYDLREYLQKAEFIELDVFDLRLGCEDDLETYLAHISSRVQVFRKVQRKYNLKALIASSEMALKLGLNLNEVFVQDKDYIFSRVFYPVYESCINNKSC